MSSYYGGIEIPDFNALFAAHRRLNVAEEAYRPITPSMQSWRAYLLRDVLLTRAGPTMPGHIEMDLGIAAAMAKVHIQTGRLRLEQKYFREAYESHPL